MAVISIKCPHCGGELVFEPSSQNYICPYCNSTFTQGEVDAMLADLPGGADDASQTPQGQNQQQAQGVGGAGVYGEASQAGTQEDAYGGGQGGQGSQGGAGADAGDGVLYTCPSCGAEIVTDDTTAATFCYYCHNPVVLSGRISGAYLPDRVIPFKINREEAVNRFLSYVGKKKYVPKAFFNAQQVEKLTGVYYPYWVYDTQVSGDLSAEGTKVKVWRMGDTEYTQTSVYHVERGGVANVNHLTRNALQKTAGELVEKVQPYTLEEMTKFSMGYLSGFMAEKRDLEKEHFQDQLRQEAGRYAGQLFQNSATGYSTLRVSNAQYQPKTENYYYALLPVWVLTYRSMTGKLYYYAMNGQTGTVAGELPLDSKKLIIHSVIVGLIVMLVCLAVAYFVF